MTTARHPFESIVDLARFRAAQQPQARTFSFLPAGEGEAVSIIDLDFDARARAVAALLQSCTVSGDRVLILVPPGLDFLAAFFGCLYAGAIAVAVYPPHPARLEAGMSRIRAIVKDARPAAALTTAEILARLEPEAGGLDLPQLRWLAVDRVSRELAAAWRPPRIDTGTPAAMQYTSGSTGMPKGVVLSHGNLLHNCSLVQQGFGLTAADQGVIWLPPYHDMGLIGGILVPLFVGFPVVLMSPLAFLQRPLRWLSAVTRFRGTVSGGPNFAYELCLEKISPEERQGLDLSSWAVAFQGAEPVRGETLDRFAETFGPQGFRREAFYPCYGLAEATLIVSGGRREEAPVLRPVDAAALERNRVEEPAGGRTRHLVGCGRSFPGQRILIVDPETREPCPPDRAGEIWVSGPSVAQGYWQRPEETAETFQARLAGSGEGPYLRTGDLGFLRDGELYVGGRIKDLIIVRGLNHYPQDIERTVERSHPGLKPGCGAAFSVETAAGERLVVVHEAAKRQETEIDAIAAAVRRAVAEAHQVHVHTFVLAQPARIPKTTSGKVQRQACRAAYLAGALPALGSSVLDDLRESPGAAAGGHAYAAPRTEAESKIVEILRQKLRLERVGIYDNLFEVGADSVTVAQIHLELEEVFGKELSPALLFEHSTVDRLARFLSEEEPAPARRQEPLTRGRQLALRQRGALERQRETGGRGQQAAEGLPPQASRPEDRAELFVVSGPTPKALRSLLRTYLKLARGEATCPPLRDVCYTASRLHSRHSHRTALVVRSRRELAEGLDAALQGRWFPPPASDERAASLVKLADHYCQGAEVDWSRLYPPGLSRIVLPERPGDLDAALLVDCPQDETS